MRSQVKTALLGATVLAGFGYTAASAMPMITTAIDEANVAPIAGEKSPLVAKAHDLGALADTTALPHIIMSLKRSPDQQAAFDKLVHDQQDRTSPMYHQWLKASQLRTYGPDAADIAKVTAWLQGRGFTVNSVSPSGMSIDFGGRPSAVASAFHTSIHNVTLANGESHIANVTDLAMPAALSPVVGGVTLSNFFPKPNVVRATTVVNARKAAAAAKGLTLSPQFDIGGYQAVTPQDFETIYNINPLLLGTAPVGKLTGKGVTVAVLERTDILAADWRTFRKAFGLSGYAGTLQTVAPGSCTDPGFNGDEGEAALDAEWIGVAAPDAKIYEAACGDTNITFGVATSLQQMVEHGSDATVFSISYGGPEATNSPSFLAYWTNLLEEANSEGISVMISTGDSGSSYDRNEIAVDGLAVNGLSTNPYNTSVGGTDFLDAYEGKTSTYWRPTNVRYYSSAKSYIPETPWDNSCAGMLIRKYGGYANAIASCNDPNNPFNFQEGVGGTGGESTLYTKPDFQNGGVPGMPTDGMRDQPDVSLFSSNGFWGHFLVLCMSDANEGGTTCDYTNVNDTFGNAAGGTSFAAPAFAGIAALLVQKNGPIGNANAELYSLAKTQFSDPTLSTQCISGYGNHASKSCVFYNVTAGNIAEPCYATTGACYSNKGSATEGIGVLRNPDAPSVDAYPATVGYSLAVGLGSVNVTNLVTAY